MMQWLKDLFIEDAARHSLDEQAAREIFEKVMQALEEEQTES